MTSLTKKLKHRLEDLSILLTAWTNL